MNTLRFTCSVNPVKMPTISYSQYFLSLLTMAVASYAFFELKSRRRKTTPRRDIHEVIMFSEPTSVIRSKHARSTVTPSLDRILQHLNAARYTLDICMYVLTNQDIALMIQKLNYRRVKVRLIIDADMAYSTGSAVRKLEKHGIEVRWMKSTYFMHHKYCIVDASTSAVDSTIVPFLIAGSLNWTNQGVSGNWEDVIVTSQAELVQGYMDEFEKLWLKFKPIVL